MKNTNKIYFSVMAENGGTILTTHEHEADALAIVKNLAYTGQSVQAAADAERYIVVRTDARGNLVQQKAG